MERTRMVLLPHDPAWRDWFRAESIRIGEALPELALRIEHIGSTSVPDLIAKPIVDIAIITRTIGDAERCAPPLTALGYEYRGQHGDDLLRRYLVLEQGGRRVAQLHVWAEESPSWREALRFRDLLRTRAELRAAYAAEKLRVAEAVGWDKAEYSIRKGPFIEAMLGSG